MIKSLAKPPAKRDKTREKIKLAAGQLFARYGIDAVTIRDIAKASGQRNGGSVNYYFGSKDELVIEILNDVARINEERRARDLDTLEASGKPITIREILRLLTGVQGMDTVELHRLFTMLQIYRRDLMHTEIPGKWDTAYQRCVDHLRRLLPDHPPKVLEQRLYFLIPFIWTFMATREGGEDRAEFWKKFWADPSTLESFLDAAEGQLIQPASVETLDAIRAFDADQADNKS
ncbi:MAG: TetR/AcrR family transcriptional regulator [Novosphingobium sp.]|nr:TetR/AcrR family transcriptional regulator [Novosphingobium sp.]